MYGEHEIDNATGKKDLKGDIKVFEAKIQAQEGTIKARQEKIKEQEDVIKQKKQEVQDPSMYLNGCCEAN